MICSNCGTENRPEARFCLKCGARLALACPNGHPVPAGALFCDQCGAQVGGAADPTTPSNVEPAKQQPHAPPTAERRLVSVLFADLVGFTPLSEKRDAEEVRDLLSKYFEAARRLIARYGGTVEKFIGDAVMAVWGTPVAQEDDAERAVRAALDLIEAVSALGQEVGAPDLKARAGVLTGEAAVTIGAEGQGMVAGDLVNTASRIQSVAEPGTVLVGETTRRSTEASIAYEEAGAYELKGKAERVALWRPLRVIAGVRGALRSAGLEPPFVGRDRELRLVKELFHGSSEERKAHLVSVVGIAGIGKSRLSWEFFKYIDGLAEGLWWHRGRCLAYGEGVTYWALAEMVRMRARIDEGEEPASAIAKLRETMERHLPDPEERKWVEPRLAQLLGLEEHSAADRQDLFSAWRLFFERLCEESPTILVFEDMQWADTALLDFVEYLLDWSRSHPLFVMALSRPELSEKHPNWAAGKRNFTSIFLEPLSPTDMDELLSGFVPGLPGELRSKILDRAEGVPLYAVETVRMLIDRGLLVQEGSRYRPAGAIESLDVPETLHALIAARLDGLMAEERRLLQAASVLGKSFTRAGLSSLSGMEDVQIDALLSSLTRKEVLSYQTDPRSAERGQYLFLQDLVKRVAYETLSRKERKANHLAAARHLEANFVAEEDEIVEVLASHYVQAYEAAPEAPDAAEIKAKVRDMLARAGERTASLAATEEARRYFEQAIEFADDTAVRARLHERAGEMAWIAGRAAEGIAHYEQAMDLYESSGLPRPAARVSAAYADILWQQGRPEEAVDRLRRAYGVLSGDEPDAAMAVVAHQLGRFLFFLGETEESLARIEEALLTAELLRLSEVFAQALNTKSLVLKIVGRIEESRILLEHALRVSLDNNLSAAALRSYNNLVALLAEDDLHQEELDMTERGLELARRVGNRVWEHKLMADQINPLFYLGRWDEAVGRADEIRNAANLASMRAVAVEFMMLQPIFVGRGDLEAARQNLQVLAEGEQSADLQVRATYDVALAQLLIGEGSYAEALDVAERGITDRNSSIRDPAVRDAVVVALDAAFRLGRMERVEELVDTLDRLRPGQVTPSIRAQTSRFRARLAAARGETEGVDSGYKGAAAAFRDGVIPFWLAVTLVEHGEWLIDQGHAPEAEPLLREARAIFEQLKAGPWLERLTNAESRVAREAPTMSGVAG
jgi:class 3 adenylate cyclase/tetratricopeptide (TPR) repeat protein